MGTFQALIADLETAVRDGQSDKRIAILRQVTDLFVVGAEGFGDEHVELFDDLLMHLTEQVENRVLAELSKKLAPVTNAPSAVIQRLARHDEIAIAGPVLSRSVRLSDSDLVEIASSKGQLHLGAISERTRLAEVVTDILVERGDDTVVRKLTRNRGAAFSNAGFGALAKRAQRDGELAENLGGHPDLPPEVLRALVVKATETVRTRLLAGASPERRAALQEAIEAAAAEVAREAAAAPDFGRAEALVKSMKQKGQLSEAAVEHFANGGQYALMVAALAELCLAPIELIYPLVQNPAYSGLLTACKACDMNWRTFCTVADKRFPGRPMAAAELDQARDDYLKMSAETAKRVYRFWLVQGVAGKPH